MTTVDDKFKKLTVQAGNDVKINPNDLSNQVADAAGVRLNWSLLSVKANQKLKDLEREFEALRAQHSLSIRRQAESSGVKTTEGKIEASLLLIPALVEKNNEVHEAKLIAEMLKRIELSMEARLNALINLVKLKTIESQTGLKL